jgi:hypothetical protein
MWSCHTNRPIAVLTVLISSSLRVPSRSRYPSSQRLQPRSSENEINAERLHKSTARYLQPSSASRARSGSAAPGEALRPRRRRRATRYLRRLPPSAPDGADRLPLPCRGVAAQGDRARSTRAPAVPRPKERLTRRRRPTASAGVSSPPEPTARAGRLAAEFLIGAGALSALTAADGMIEVELASETTVRACSVVLAFGVAYRRLEATGIDRLIGRGVRYGAAPGGRRPTVTVEWSYRPRQLTGELACRRRDRALDSRRTSSSARITFCFSRAASR